MAKRTEKKKVNRRFGRRAALIGLLCCALAPVFALGAWLCARPRTAG